MASLFVGLMSGTSMDAVDAALVDLDTVPPRLLCTHSHPIPDLLARPLRALAAGEDLTLDALGALDARLGELFAGAALALLEKAGVKAAAVSAIGSHGQTVRHRPDAQAPFTLQLGDPNLIAGRTGIVTVADFRRRDMAAGGQGAPLAPAFHAHALRSASEHRVVVNLGGIANITVLPATGDVTGFDTGPGNALLDAWIRQQQDASHDTGGQWAASGTPDPGLLETLLRDPFFRKPPPKSTGTEYFNLEWLRPHLPDAIRPEDVQATLALLTARSVVGAIGRAPTRPARVLVCGGGVHNTHLMALLERELDGIPVGSTADAGVDPDWLEAMAFAWLARQRLEGKAGNLPAVTGARVAVPLGAIYAR